MPEQVREVLHYSVSIPDKVGEGARVLGALRDAGVNLTASWGYPAGKGGTQVTAVSNGHAATSADFDCPSCGHHFQQGDGGETGGMCEPCFDAELQSAHEEAAKKRAKTAA